MSNFSFIENKLTRESLRWDYDIIKKYNLIRYFKNRDPNAPFFLNNDLNRYEWYHLHTCASWTYSMRSMEHIAKYGWDSFVQKQMNEK
jgi:hypothetical protein